MGNGGWWSWASVRNLRYEKTVEACRGGDWAGSVPSSWHPGMNPGAQMLQRCKITPRTSRPLLLTSYLGCPTNDQRLEALHSTVHGSRAVADQLHQGAPQRGSQRRSRVSRPSNPLHLFLASPRQPSWSSREPHVTSLTHRHRPLVAGP
jgi:hypothetical protein